MATFAANNLTQQVEIWYGGIKMGGTSAAADLNLASKSTGNMLLLTNGTERISILGSNGNVGIGLPSGIGSKLQVNGNAAIGYSASTAAPTNGLAVSGNLTIGTTTANGSLQVSGASGTGFLTAQRLDNTTNSAYQSWSFGGSTAGGIAGFVNANILEAVPFSTGNFVISAFSNNIVFMTNNRNERMRITSAGSVGILTSTIGSSIQINGNAAIGYSASTAAPSNGLVVSGRVLVNTTTDNGQGVLQANGGITATNVSLSGELVSATTTFNATYYHIISTAASSGQTFTLPSPTSNNYQYVVINKSIFPQTISAGSGLTIYDMTGTDSATITLAAKARCFIIADGSGFYQIF
jgi:hypothetical protein